MRPQRRAPRSESGAGRALARAGFLARACRVRGLFCRFLRHVTLKARPCARPAAKADRVTPRAHPRRPAEADRSVRAGSCEHAVRPAARRACTCLDERHVRRCTSAHAGNRACTQTEDQTGDRDRKADPRSDGPKTRDRKSTRLNSSHGSISYAVFCLKKKKNKQKTEDLRSSYTKVANGATVKPGLVTLL